MATSTHAGPGNHEILTTEKLREMFDSLAAEEPKALLLIPRGSQFFMHKVKASIAASWLYGRYNTFDDEPLCPKCKMESMKEFALTLRCRGLSCRHEIMKKFPPKGG